MIRALGIGLLAAAFAAPPATAHAADAATPKTHAVLVGVGQYADAAIKSRPHAEDDAKALYDLVTDPKYLGIPGADVHLLLGSKDDKRGSQTATRENILKAVRDVVAKAAKDDLVIIALIGQGGPLNDRATCLFATDSTVKDRAKDAVASADLEKEFEKFKGEKLCVFVDVNLKGIDAPKDKALLEPNPLDMIRAFVGSEDKEEHTLPQGRVVFLATSTVTPSLDLPQSGLFTKSVIDGLKGAADKDGYEADGVVTVDELDVYLEKAIPDQAREIGKTREERQQTPIVWGGRASHFVLTHNPAVQTTVDARLAKIAATDLQADVKAEGKKLLARMPKLKLDQDLRKQYQQLADGKLTAEQFGELRGKNIAQRKLPRDDAETFARKVMDGVSTVRGSYVKELNQGEMVAWAVRGMYRRLEEKIPDNVKVRLDGIKELRRGALESLLADVRESLGSREDLDGNKGADIAIGMMLYGNLDPYTTYIDKESLAKSKIDFQGMFTGIGIQIRRDMERDGLLVVTPIKDSPGYKKGIQTGDLITHITTEMDKDGHKMEEREKVSTKGLRTEDAVKRILGEPGTKIGVTIVREGATEPIDLELRRGRVEVETVMGVKRTEDDGWDYMLDPVSKIGYIRLSQFISRSYPDMEAAVKKLEKAGMKGLVFDMRFNPGGLLTSAVQISDMFIDDGLIVTIRPRVGEEQPYIGTSGGHLNFPIACMVNGSSASGSEIVSACLQDHGRAKIVGERSYGKGSVQNIQPFKPTGGEIKLTTASFWRPNGKNLNKSSTKGKDDEDWGVRPDAGFEVKLEKKELFELQEHLRDAEIIQPKNTAAKPKEPKPEFKDRQLEAALDYLRAQIKTASRNEPRKAG